MCIRDRNTGDKRYFTYVEEWADSLINEKGEIHLYDMSTYNLDYIHSGKVLFDLYKETGKEKYKAAMDLLVLHISFYSSIIGIFLWLKDVYKRQAIKDGILGMDM